jgi:hypothetical protein
MPWIGIGIVCQDEQDLIGSESAEDLLKGKGKRVIVNGVGTYGVLLIVVFAIRHMCVNWLCLELIAKIVESD